MTTPLYELEEVSVSVAEKEVQFNEMLQQLEARAFRVKSQSTTAQPGSPANGDAYIIPTGATGADWSGQDGNVGSYIAGAWTFSAPYNSMPIYVDDEGVDYVYDGTDFIARTVNPLLSKDVAGGSDVTLSAIEARNDIMQFTGALTGNISVIVPTTTKILAIYNNTSGAFTLTVKVSGQTGVAVGQGNRAMLYCDGTDVVRLAADV